MVAVVVARQLDDSVVLSPELLDAFTLPRK